MSDGTMFAGDHGPEGVWSSLKGKMLSPHEEPPLNGTNSGDARFNGEAGGTPGWESSLKPTEGLTRGGGTMAK